VRLLPHRTLGTLRAVRTAVGVVLAALAVVVVGAGAAQAHASLLGSSPANGARLTRAPAVVTLLFDEQVQVRSDGLEVTRARGGDVAADAAYHPGGDPLRVAIRLRPRLPADSYLIRYGAVSADGHPISGAVAFVVGDGPLIDASGTPTDARGADPAVSAAYAIARWVAFCGLAGLGGLVFVTVCWPAGATDPRARRLVGGAWLAATAGSLAALLLQGPYAERRGLGGALSGGLLRDTLALPVGKVLVLRLVSLGAVAYVAARVMRLTGRPAADERSAEVAGMAVALPLLAGFAGAGHAESGSQPTAVVISNMAHIGAMAIWLGGLLMLSIALLPGRPTGELAETLARFGRVATCAVTLVVLTGCYQSWRQLGSVSAAWQTGYGRLLLVKLAGVMAVCLLGLVSSRAIRRGLLAQTRPLAVGASVAGGAGPVAPPSTPPAPPAAPVFEPGALRRLRLAAGAETAVALAVLLASALLVSTAPPRLSGAPAGPPIPASAAALVRVAS
jgi:copper transport protein